MKKLSFIVLLISTLFISGVAFTQTSNDDKTRKIEVAGSAEMKVVPDEIYVNFTLQEYYNKQKTKIDIDQIQKDFLDRCNKAGIGKDRIQIQNMSGFDSNAWYWNKRKKEQPDLLSSTTYIIKFSAASDIDKLVNSLDDNATQNMFISKKTHSKIEGFRKEVKIKALQAAKTKAQYLCESINEKAGKVLFIQEIGNETIVPMYNNRMDANSRMEMSEATANEDVDFQKITIRYEMFARFEIQ